MNIEDKDSCKALRELSTLIADVCCSTYEADRVVFDWCNAIDRLDMADAELLDDSRDAE